MGGLFKGDVMSYTPSKETRKVLRDLYEMKGSYAGVARELNKGRRDDDKFSARQVSRMLAQERKRDEGAKGGWSNRDKPQGVNLTKAQQRSLQRKSKETSQNYRRTYDDYREKPRSDEALNKIQGNIVNKRERLNRKRDEYMAAGDKGSADKINEQLKRLDRFDDKLNKAAKGAKNYREWKGIKELSS